MFSGCLTLQFSKGKIKVTAALKPFFKKVLPAQFAINCMWSHLSKSFHILTYFLPHLSMATLS